MSISQPHCSPTSSGTKGMMLEVRGARNQCRSLLFINYVQSFFRAKLRAIKEKQVQYDQKFDKTTAQLQQLEELLYYAIVMLKRGFPLLKMFQQAPLLQQSHQKMHQKLLLQQLQSQSILHLRKEKAIISFLFLYFFFFQVKVLFVGTMFIFFSSPLALCVKKEEKYLACMDKYLYILIFIVFIYFQNFFFSGTHVFCQKDAKEREIIKAHFCCPYCWQN